MSIETATAAPETTAAAPRTEYVGPLLVQLEFLQRVLHVNLEGITHAESLCSPETGGNCINWVLGHVTNARQGWLGMVLGQQPVVDPARLQRYKRGSSPLVEAGEALPFEELLSLFDASQAPLRTGLASLTAARLAEPAPFSPGGDPSETVASLVAKLALHEAYHIGQMGILRRFLRRPGAIA